MTVSSGLLATVVAWSRLSKGSGIASEPKASGMPRDNNVRKGAVSTARLSDHDTELSCAIHVRTRDAVGMLQTHAKQGPACRGGELFHLGEHDVGGRVPHDVKDELVIVFECGRQDLAVPFPGEIEPPVPVRPARIGSRLECQLLDR